MHIRSAAASGRWRLFAPVVALGALFVVTRLFLLLLTVREQNFVLPSVTADVRDIYLGWFDVLREGRFPASDEKWQYPPAAALVMLAPGIMPFNYVDSFYVLSFLVDVGTFVVLVRASRRHGPERATGQPWAAWIWTVGVALGGPIGYGRYDLIVTGVAVSGLVLLAGLAPEDRDAARRRWWGGALLAFGALLKVWPGLLLLGVGPGRRWKQAWTGAVVSGVALTAAFTLAMPGAMSFLSHQGGRGIEVESIGALPFQVAVHHGWGGRVALSYGSMEYIGPHVQLVAKICLALSVVALGWLVLWRSSARTWRVSTTADAAFVAVLLFVVTSRVISPQYMVWLVGLAAVCALHFGPSGDSVMRLPAGLVLVATALSCVEYPYYFQELLAAERGAVLLVTVRNLLLVAAALIGATRLWRTTRVQPRRVEHLAAPAAVAAPATQEK